MITFKIPEPAVQKLGLTPIPDTTKGLRSTTPPESTISLGGPAVIALTADAVKEDPDLIEYVKQTQNSHHFFLIHLACTFLPERSESFSRAWVQIRLSRSDGKDTPKPIAWSMKPQKLSEDVEVTQTAKIGSKFELLEAGVESGEKRTYKLVYLQPLNELQWNPTWYLKSIEGVDIDGLYRFQLIVQSPADITALGEIELSAELRRKKWGLLPYKAVFPGAPHLVFPLG
jgi:hypothetical protein